MKSLLIAVLITSGMANADTFEKEASELALSLKKSLMQELSQQIEKGGVASAVPFCHENVKPIAKKTAGKYLDKYEFGRTSHKIRNSNNAPQEWIRPYLDKYKGKMKDEDLVKPILVKLNNSKRVYLEPLFVQAKCLLCHGENVASNVKETISKIYPDDRATGFKLGEFRGFLWVKEK